jgi:signal transduction histidine kinase
VPRPSGLQSKLILAFLLVLLIPTGIIAFYSINTASNTLIEKISAEELQSVSAEVSAIQARLQNISSDVLYLSEASSTRSYLSVLGSTTDAAQTAAQAQLNFFQSFLSRSPQYQAVSIITTSGREVMHVAAGVNGGTPQIVMPDTKNQAGSAYYQRAIALPAGQTYISLFDLATTNGNIDEPYISFLRYAVPLRTDTGSVRGILVLKALLAPILQDKFFQDKSARTYLVDNDGSYIYQPDSTKLYNRILKNGVILEKEQPNDLQLLYASEQGTLLASKDKPESLQSFAHITLQGQTDVRWLLIREGAISSILAEVNNAQLVIAIIAVVALIVAVIVALVFTYNIVRPVRQLAQVADTVSLGNWDMPVPQINTGDEIGHLAAAFERMLRELRLLYSGLENRVKARTAELETANKQLLIAQERAEQASNAKSAFLSNMSHELRTPLNVVLGYSSSMLNMPEMFENVELPKVYREYIQLIETSGHYLLGLINDILDLSKIESNKFELRCMVINPQDIFEGVISTAIGLVKGKPIQIRPDFPNDLPMIWADGMRVRQIILNLLSNAIKFTETGSVTLMARVEDKSIKVSIIDTGIGIPEQALATIFDRFKQVEDASGKHYGGTGLGLDISKQLCLLHGSDLTVQSTFGKGSTFSFSLPIATTEQLGIEQVPEISAGAASIFDPAIVSAPPDGVILLVEQESSTRELLHQTLEGAALVVIDLNDGTKVPDMASGLLPNIIILDGDMSEPDAWEVVRILRSDPETRTLPVIICADGNKQQPLDDTTVRYVDKPIVRNQILAAVDVIFERLPVNGKEN